jgi:hypothetical protein
VNVKMTLRYIHPADETLRAVVELAARQSSKIVPGGTANARPDMRKHLQRRSYACDPRERGREGGGLQNYYKRLSR